MLSSLDPKIVELLAALENSGAPRLETLLPATAREVFARSRLASAMIAPELCSTRDVMISTEDGAVPAKLYRPKSAKVVLPGLVFFHGGGWVVGAISSYDDICAVLADKSGCLVMSVGYRLAPEHKFPAAVVDAAASLRWFVQNSIECGVDPQRIAVAGDSAGANLAAVVAIMSRAGDLPPIALQILIYPVTDLSLGSPSHAEAMPGTRFTTATMRWFRDHYLRVEADRLDWRASPLVSGNLRCVAPAFILTAGADPLRDDGILYAEKLRQADVYVRHTHYPDQVHGFINFGRLLPKANNALEEIAAEIQRATKS